MNKEEELLKCTVVTLRNVLRKQGLPTAGRKNELLERVRQNKLQNMATRIKGGSSPRQRVAADALDGGRPNGTHSSQANGMEAERKRQSEMEKKERDQLVLWRRPLTTLQYCSLELLFLAKNFGLRLWKAKKMVALFIFLLAVATVIYYSEGPHQSTIAAFEKKVLWCLYWVGLGVLSSVGLGTGLHTFILYLGPHIAMVTLAAYECNTVNFPEPPYPSEVICPEEEGKGVSVWSIMSKVRLEAVMWGAGTALGELPPYFMARTARLSGSDIEDDEFEEIEELIHEKQEHPQDLGMMERAKLWVHNLVQKVGFFGILACASIPNPLFDLAGITCGHFLVPFWTFFGATLIGKAILKMHLQKVFVIVLFNERHVESVITLMGKLPFIGKALQEPFRDWLSKQKASYHRKPGGPGTSPSDNWLSAIFEKILLVMVVYFVLSIVNSSAQSYHKRICKARRTLVKAGVNDYTRIIKKDNID